MQQLLQRMRPFLPYVFLVALLLWGGYVTLYFLGIDGHIVVLTPEGVWQAIAQDFSSPFERGLHALKPAAQHLLHVLAPFKWYAAISLLLYGMFVVYSVLKRGKLYIDVQFSALHILLLFVGSLWLITTTFFYSPVTGLQPRLLIQPSAEVYGNVGPEALTALEENFARLQESGCLNPTELRAKAGAPVFRYKGWCMQKAFVALSLSLVGMLLLLVLDWLVLGRVLLRIVRLQPASRWIEFLMSMGLGAAIMIALFWFLALFHVFQQSVVWVLLLLLPVIGFRHSFYWLKQSYSSRWRVNVSFHALSVFFLWLLISYLAFNFFTVVRPFPIGWDDLGRYINGPRQMSVYGYMIPGMMVMKWEYLTSLGFVLFGYFSTFGATFSMMINWFAGVFAVLGVYACTRYLLGPGTGLLAALFYYTLPMVGHFSFADMKTENAIFAFGVFGLLAVFQYLRAEGAEGKEDTEVPRPSEVTSVPSSYRWLFIAGILFAAGFATKPTIVLLFFVAGIIIGFRLLGNLGGLGVTSIMLMATVFFGVKPNEILQKVTGGTIPNLRMMTVLALGLLSIFLLILPQLIARWKKRPMQWSALRSCVLAGGVLLGGFLFYSAPWMVQNSYMNIQANGRTGVPLPGGYPNMLTPRLEYKEESVTDKHPPGSRGLPPHLQIDLDHEMCKGTAREEELDRYWGYGSGWEHYLGLPWRVVMNKDSQGYYLTTSPLILLIPLLLLIPSFWGHKLLRSLFWGTTFYVLIWVFKASGIPWYGIGMFLGFAIFVEALIHLPTSAASRAVAVTFVLVGIAMTFSLRMWQFEMQRNLYEYAWGKASADVLQEMTIPDYDDIMEQVVELSKNPERPYLYRMGTFITYFIPRNLEIVVLNDNQLGFFNCINQEQDHMLTLQRLWALGIHSIVFDTNTATIERDSNGTLHKKVNRFLDFANDPEVRIVSVVNNPGNGIAYMILPNPAEFEEDEAEDGVVEESE